ARIDRMQHRRRRAVELAVVALEPSLLADLGVDDDRPQIVASLAPLDDRAREAVDPLAALRRQVHGDTLDAPGPAQHRQVLLGLPARGLGAAQVLWPVPSDLLAGVAEALQPRIARVETVALLVERDDQRGHLTE